jgi:hypothetical protein
LFVEKNFPDSKLSKQINDPLFVTSNFYDSKHLRSVKNYIHLTNFQLLNKKKVNQQEDENELKLPYDLINSNFLYRKNILDTINTHESEFEIDKLKIYVNNSKQTKNSICFGFIQIVLKWTFPDTKQMLENLEPISELFRYYGEYNHNKFELCWNNELINTEINEIEKRNQSGRIPEKNLEINSKKINEYKKLLLHSNPKKIHFKLLVDALLGQIIPNINIDGLFEFEKESLIKPYILHLSNFKNDNDLNFINFESNEVIRLSYRLLRIPGSNNVEINKTSDLKFISPDLYSRLFILNEGAIIVEGSPVLSDLLNKYYPAFLFALNQKYLFHYMQEKINELPWDETDNKYKSDKLKDLQQTMIYAEFSQIFTSISNYNEIDLFFEKLRDQFKINQLKKEFLESINGISKITQINEKEEEESKRIFERKRDEEISELRAKKLDGVLLLLTIAQVWTGLYSSSPLEKFADGWYYNLGAYVLLGLVGLVRYFKIEKKEIKAQKKEYLQS